MGVLDLLRSAQQLARVEQSAGMANVRAAPLSPWQTGTLQSIPWNDVFGVDSAPVTVAEAMKVPAVVKGRAILHSLIVSRPLVSLRELNGRSERVDPQPRFLYRSDSGVATEQRLAATLDDLLFLGEALWIVDRGAAPSNGGLAPILNAEHVPWDRWEIDPDGFVLIDHVRARSDEVIYFPGPSRGLLEEAGETIRAARDMQRAWAARVRTPAPSILLQDTDTNPMTDAEVDDMLGKVRAARRSPDGAVAYIPAGITATFANPNDDAGLFIEGRNAIRLDIANHFNLPGALLDGSVSVASLTYSTQEGRRDEVADFSLGYWLTPIQAPLSQDNVVPRGQRVRFDFGDLFTPMNAPTGAVTPD